MIPTSSWRIGITTTSSYTYKEALLPTPYVATIADFENSDQGSSVPSIVNVVRTIGTPSNTLRITNGVYAEMKLNNAYDVILLDTIYNTAV